ncbi:hypothetical protein LCGC14_2883970, partial [marine sediment metagenome]
MAARMSVRAANEPSVATIVRHEATPMTITSTAPNNIKSADVSPALPETLPISR